MGGRDEGEDGVGWGLDEDSMGAGGEVLNGHAGRENIGAVEPWRGGNCY